MAVSGKQTGWRYDPNNSRLDIYYRGTRVGDVSASGLALATGNQTFADDLLLGLGTGNTARLSWDTTDANANALLLQMPAGGAVDVPVLAIGQSIESVDLGLYNGVVDPRIALFGVGAVTTGPVLESRKARGTIASPTVVTTGDDLLSIRAYGAVAAGEYVQAGEIRFDMAGTIATTRGPGTITFLTATDAAPSVLTAALTLGANQAATFGADAIVVDDALLSVGTGQTARLSYDTTDANANAVYFQLPAGGGTDVPVIVIGQSIESVDLGLYNGVVDPRIAMLGVGAVTTGPGIDFRKARGTAASPTVVTSGDDLGTIRAYGAVAAGEYVQAAEIRFDMAGTIATTRGPGTITFLTATDAAPSVLTAAMSISAAQVVDVPQGTLSIGTSGSVLGQLLLDGSSSGTVTMTVAAAAGTYTMTLPSAANTNAGYQLTCAGADTITSWGAAGSLRDLKDIQGEHSAQDALDKVLATRVYDFHYKDGKGTQDSKTAYVGVLADEAPWAMHYDGGVVNPVNTLGYSILAVQALAKRVMSLEQQVAAQAS